MIKIFTTREGKLADQNDSKNSPWEEVLEEIPEDKPKVFGSLDESAKPPSSQPMTLKVPSSIPDGVGSKIPAQDAVKADEETNKEQVSPQSEAVKLPPTKPVEEVKTKPILPSSPVKKGLFGIFNKKPAAAQPPVAPPATTKTPEVQPTVTQQPVKPATPLPQVANQLPVKPPESRPVAPPSPTGPVAKPINKSGVPGKGYPINQAPAPQIETTKSPMPNLFGPVKEFLTKPKVIIFEIIIVLLVGLIYFNETGFLPTGLEKVYGIFKLESLWGGLPADPQLALAKSFQQMKYQQSFSLQAEVKFSVNSTSESNITKPLLSLKNPIFLFALDKARLAAVDQNDQTAQSATDTTGSTGSSTPGQSSVNSAATTQDSQSTTTTSTSSTIKEFSSKANAFLSRTGATAKIEITSESGKISDLNLVEEASKLYTRSSNVDYSGSAKDWVQSNLTLGGSEILPAIFDSVNTSGLSITGNRLGSGRVNGLPVYRYQVNIKIGSLLENVGIKDEMINSIEGEIDLGKKDQLIHYADLVIIPGVNSAITRIDFKGAISDYGVMQAISVPQTSTETPTNTSTPVETAPATQTTPPATGPSAELLARDSQRKADLRLIQAALDKYYLANNKYPSTKNVEIQTRTGGNILTKVLVPKYLSAMPVDPLSDKYYYGYKSDGKSYELSAVLGNISDTEGTMVGSLNLFVIKH